MRVSPGIMIGGTIGWCVAGSMAMAQRTTLPRMSDASKECIECHKTTNPGIYQQWGSSLHFRGNIGCYECHQANEGEPDAYEHFDKFISQFRKAMEEQGKEK